MSVGFQKKIGSLRIIHFEFHLWLYYRYAIVKSGRNLNTCEPKVKGRITFSLQLLQKKTKKKRFFTMNIWSKLIIFSFQNTDALETQKLK